MQISIGLYADFGKTIKYPENKIFPQSRKIVPTEMNESPV